MLRKILPIGKLELCLAALLDGNRRNVALADRITQDRGAEFLVHQDASALLGHPVRKRLLKAGIDDVFTVCNGDYLLGVQRLFPAEESRNVGRTMVEREEIERSCIASRHE